MEKFGKYEILEKIGEGGFGVIFKGFDPLIKRTVAIKTCTSDDQDIRNRFFQEAEIAGNLQHRNITIVFDFGIESGVPYLVQEYLGGEDLDRKVKRRDPMSFGTKLLYLVQMARGLQFAHSRGIIHRDIKPSNIRVLDDDTVKIMDFGIAKLAHAEQSSLTQTGQTIGTAAYLAPEQIRGDVIDQRADIFAFGLLTYELLTGSRAFAGDNPSSVIYQVLTEEPRAITDYDPDCPAEMIAIVERCIAKNPDDRYPDCATLLADLDHLIEFRDDRGQPSRRAAVSPAVASRGASRARPPSEATTVRSSPHSTVAVLPRTSIDHLRLRADEPAAPSSPIVTAGAARARRRSGVLGYVLLFLLMGLLGAGAWWYWERYLPARQLPGSADEEGAQAADGASPPAADAPEAAAPEPGAAAAAQTNPAPGEAVAVDGGDGGSDAGPETSAGTEEPPPPPPPPPRGTLVLPAAWDPAMTVSVNGGRALVLDREHRLQLPPGSYDLVFDLVTRDYDATAETSIVLRGGQTRTSTLPIPRPAQIQVRQMPGSPRGWVLTDDDPLGWSPISERQLAPGDYELVIKRGPTEADDVEISYPVTLHPDRLLIVTFDLRRTGPPTLVERPARR